MWTCTPQTTLLVEALVFSGSPNPVLNVTGSQRLCEIMSKPPPPTPSCRIVGFRGWRVHDGAGASVLLRGSAAADVAIQDTAAFAALQESVRAHIVTEGARLIFNPEADGRCAAASAEADAALLAVSAAASASCTGVVTGPDDPTEIVYAPTTDDEGCFVSQQQHNNCYNYANDIVNNNFAQPGRGSGVCSKTSRPCVPNTCEDVRKGAESDNLVWMGTDLPTELPNAGHYVSLHIWPDSNFHWLRMDADKMWSHKPGSNPVRNVDNNGKTIDDPAKADVSPWTNHCGYMLATPSKVTIY
jgi:hypothetical protein